MNQTVLNRNAMIVAMFLALSCLFVSCGSGGGDSAVTGVDPQVTARGTVEVTARLAEIPEGAIFERELYDYTTILKYTVLKVHRGNVQGETIYVGHYNPFKRRSEASDQRVKDIGGNLTRFQAGQLHRMALEAPIDDYFMGGIVNKYFGQSTEPIYWAVWTNLAGEP